MSFCSMMDPAMMSKLEKLMYVADKFRVRRDLYQYFVHRSKLICEKNWSLKKLTNVIKNLQML